MAIFCRRVKMGSADILSLSSEQLTRQETLQYALT